jgi:predicted RNA binding protein YcfA (HicA-like mRNA interferase family)
VRDLLLTARGVINRLRREGWAERAGNWLLIFTKPGSNPIIVPRHGGDIPNGTLRSICRALGWEYPPRS